MDISLLVAAQLSGNNQITFDPEEFDLAMCKANERHEKWRRRLAWIGSVWAMLRRNRQPRAWLAKPAAAK